MLWNPQIATSDASFGVGPNGFGFTMSGTANIPIVMEAAVDLATPVWISLHTCTLTNGSLYFADPDWAIIGMNQLNRHIPRRADAWVEIHKDYLDAVVPGTDHELWLRECGLPVFMVDRFPKLPTSVRYPVDRLIQKFSIDYFTSTVAYMFAWATDYIDQRVEAQLKTSPGNGLASAYDVMQLQRSLYEE